ncbi:copper-binding protein [Candidatus Saccharibacteria bacterium CG_4_10_14_0_2_um_filter_52_9]|nr:MAG: copper-binding protein [Candidatus Saccharibacteria bacterium CG_4_10_14_0_2_um_filter_52_9]
MTELIVLLGSLSSIALIIWWFFMKPDTEVVAATVNGNEQTVNIIVSGGYTPHKILLQKDIPAKLIFNRKDASSCLEEVILPDFGVQRKLPVNQDLTIEVKPDKAGRFTYSCGMHMFFGEVIVK